MRNERTLKIRKGDGFEVISHEDYDPSTHELLVDKDEMVVKPKGVDGAKPFVIDKKDFDPRSYEQVKATAKVAEEIAHQQPHDTLQELAEQKEDE